MKELYTCTDCGACGMYEDMGEKIDFCAGHGLPNYVSVKGSKKERLDRLKSSWEMDKKKDDERRIMKLDADHGILLINNYIVYILERVI